MASIRRSAICRRTGDDAYLLHVYLLQVYSLDVYLLHAYLLQVYSLDVYLLHVAMMVEPLSTDHLLSPALTTVKQ